MTINITNIMETNIKHGEKTVLIGRNVNKGLIATNRICIKLQIEDCARTNYVREQRICNIDNGEVFGHHN